MTRVLLIEGDRARADAFAMECVDQGIAVHLAENMCDGVRVLIEVPVSLVLIDAALMRLPASDQYRLFDAVAPGVPVLVFVNGRASLDEMSRLEAQGFQVVAWPVDILDFLTKVGHPAQSGTSRPDAPDRTAALCSG